MISVLGTGLLGSGFARALRKKGETVHVWNRTARGQRPSRPRAASRSPMQPRRCAARRASTSSSRDDAAVDSVLARAATGSTRGRSCYDHTTTSPQARARAHGDWRARGVTYLHAPVFMGPQNALEATGPDAGLRRPRRASTTVTPAARADDRQARRLRPEEGRAAAIKLLGNLFLMALAAGFTDMIALGKAMGVSPDEVGDAVRALQPGLVAAGALQADDRGRLRPAELGARDGAQGRAAHAGGGARRHSW